MRIAGRNTGRALGWAVRCGAAFFALSLLTACQGGNVASKATPVGEDGRPVQLTAPLQREAEAASGDLRQPLDEAELAKAVERYRLNMKSSKSRYRSVGVDLDRDGTPEALVLMEEGADWCANTGCTLAIFEQSPTGYRAIDTVRRVWPPIIVASERDNGRNALVVNTGVAGAREQRVRLRFGASGYPGNAITQTPLPADIVVDGVVVLDKLAPPPQDLVSNTKP